MLITTEIINQQICTLGEYIYQFVLTQKNHPAGNIYKLIIKRYLLETKVCEEVLNETISSGWFPSMDTEPSNLYEMIVAGLASNHSIISDDEYFYVGLTAYDSVNEDSKYKIIKFMISKSDEIFTISQPEAFTEILLGSYDTSITYSFAYSLDDSNIIIFSNTTMYPDELYHTTYSKITGIAVSEAVTIAVPSLVVATVSTLKVINDLYVIILESNPNIISVQIDKLTLELIGTSQYGYYIGSINSLKINNKVVLFNGLEILLWDCINQRFINIGSLVNLNMQCMYIVSCSESISGENLFIAFNDGTIYNLADEISSNVPNDTVVIISSPNKTSPCIELNKSNLLKISAPIGSVWYKDVNGDFEKLDASWYGYSISGDTSILGWNNI